MFLTIRFVALILTGEIPGVILLSDSYTFK